MHIYTSYCVHRLLLHYCYLNNQQWGTLWPTDPVPVRDQSHEAGLPRGERAAAPPSRLPERKAGQEEHGALSRRPSVRPPRRPQPRTVSLFPRRNVTLYILYLLIYYHLLYPAAAPASWWFKLHHETKKKTKRALTLKLSTLLRNWNCAAGLWEVGGGWEG